MKPRLKPEEVEEYVGNSATLAALLEVSAYPKPGNVHRLRDFHDTTYEHFLAGATALGRVMGQVARRASEIGDPGKAGMGRGVLEAVEAVNRWHRGGNTHLGVALLFTPLSTAASLTLVNRAPTAETLREKLVEAIRKAGVDDTLKLVEAVALAAPPHVLRGTDKLDVTNTETRIQVVQDRATPIELFRLCQKRDAICREWLTYFVVDEEDEALRELAQKAPSTNCKDYGKTSYEIYKEVDLDFTQVDPALFAPAEITLTSAKTGTTFTAGRVNHKLIKKLALG